MTRLSVNIDHVATLREARGVSYPDPLEAARLAEAAGAHGITVHLRSDRRHIQDRDVEALHEVTRGKLNLEMAATDEMLEIATHLRPDQVTLVPERPEEVTTEGGLDLGSQGERTREATARLKEAGIDTSVFLDPDPLQIERLSVLGPSIAGFEINTDRYTRAHLAGDQSATERELAAVSRAAMDGRDLGLAVYAGHGLTVASVGAVAALEPVEELNIGHAIVARAVLVGIDAAVREMLGAIGA